MDQRKSNAEEDRTAEESLKSYAAYSVAVLEGATYRRFGRYIRLYPDPICILPNER